MTAPAADTAAPEETPRQATASEIQESICRPALRHSQHGRSEAKPGGAGAPPLRSRRSR
jgi:hypothetical protein